MEYKNIGYQILTSKTIPDTKIVTISDLNFNKETDKHDMIDLVLSINDLMPNYVFILGNICTYDQIQYTVFENNLNCFFELLSCISKIYVVFGSNDYKINNLEKKYLIQIEKLIALYQKYNMQIVNNILIENKDLNIVGFNKDPNSYNNIEKAKQELLTLLNEIKEKIDNNKFSTLITHYDLLNLKMEKELLEIFDIILTGTNQKTIKATGLFQKEIEEQIINKKEFIKTGGISNGEIGLIKIKTLKKD